MSENKCRVLNFEMNLQDYEPIISERLKNDGIWEPVETLIAGKYIKRNDIVVDVGAHIGYYALLFSYLVGKEGRVFAFEPELKNFLLLQENMHLNKTRNVVTEELAVSDVDKEKALFYLTGYMTGHHSLIDVQETDEIVEVRQVSLDTYFYPGTPIDFVKIDTEGNECNVLKGMTSVIKDNPKIKILCEFSKDNLSDFGRTQEELYDILRGFGFTVYAIEIGFKDLVEIKPEDLDWFIENNEKYVYYRNVFAMKE